MLRHLIGRVLLVLGVAFFIAVVSPIILTSQAALIILSAALIALSISLFTALIVSKEEKVVPHA